MQEVFSLWTHFVLAAKLEEWFASYSLAWRMKNKESELNRIREVIQYLCDYLRRSID